MVRVETESLDIANLQIVALSASQADALHQAQSTTAALEAALQSLRAIGSLKAAQGLEWELAKEKRRTRALLQSDPAVADAFCRLRSLEAQEDCQQQRLVAQQNERKRAALKAIADRDAAVADFKKTKKAIQDLEGVLASKHAVKNYPLEELGAGKPNAGGAKGKKNRGEVLDRLARLGAGLSAGQKNDWQWCKDAWDSKMVAEHKEKWPETFSAWVQNVLEDERSNAFSVFVHSETLRCFPGIAALQVPGS